MKTKPDDITLTQWMDGELTGEPLRDVEAWAAKHPALMEERNAVQAMSASIREHVPESIEPPYPDFFNQRILRSIQEKTATHTPSFKKNREKARHFWQWFAMPVAAGAMTVCFYLGTQMKSAPDIPGTQVVVATSTTDSSVYTPDEAVQADMFTSKDAKAIVIVLEGLEDIPDDLEMAGEPFTKSPHGMMINTNPSDSTF